MKYGLKSPFNVEKLWKNERASLLFNECAANDEKSARKFKRKKKNWGK